MSITTDQSSTNSQTRPGAEQQTTALTTPVVTGERLASIVRRAIAKRSFCMLATTSSAGLSHVSGLHYKAIGTTLYANTRASTRKARNVADNPHVAVSIAVRRMPIGHPSLVLFQGTADLLTADDPEISEMLEDGTLKSLTRVGELKLPDLVFLRITPNRRINTYALGMPLTRLIRNPLDAAGLIEIP